MEIFSQTSAITVISKLYHKPTLNFFLLKLCLRQFVRYQAAQTVAQKTQGINCPGKRKNGRKCRGKLHDTILDWEDGLPDDDLELAEIHSRLFE